MVIEIIGRFETAIMQLVLRVISRRLDRNWRN